jgi:hypothetical protein
MFGSKNKKPLYTVVISEKETPNMNIPQQRTNIPPPPAQRANISIQPMSIEKLIGGYKNEEEEEEMLPGFRYLKKMKNDFKKERIRSVLRKH